MKLLDFGLAKSVEQAPESSVTQTVPTQLGAILGTPRYMALEQAQGKPVDRRADIWAFGCVLYERSTKRQRARRRALN